MIFPNCPAALNGWNRPGKTNDVVRFLHRVCVWVCARYVYVFDTWGKASVKLADTVGCRAISLSFWVKLTPPQGGDLGETDAAAAIGRGLVREAMLLIKNTGEAEGFVVDVEVSQVNY